MMRLLQERYKEKKKKYVFVDLEKASDRVPREVIAWALRRQTVGGIEIISEGVKESE